MPIRPRNGDHVLGNDDMNRRCGLIRPNPDSLLTARAFRIILVTIEGGTVPRCHSQPHIPGVIRVELYVTGARAQRFRTTERCIGVDKQVNARMVKPFGRVPRIGQRSKGEGKNDIVSLEHYLKCGEIKEPAMGRKSVVRWVKIGAGPHIIASAVAIRKDDVTLRACPNGDTY